MADVTGYEMLGKWRECVTRPSGITDSMAYAVAVGELQPFLEALSAEVEKRRNLISSSHYSCYVGSHEINEAVTDFADAIERIVGKKPFTMRAVSTKRASQKGGEDEGKKSLALSL
jgi:hypothetical protein